MYRIDRQTPDQMRVRHIPRTQRAVGLAFVLAGVSVLVWVFPTLVSLRCDRQQGRCTLEQSGFLRSRVETWTVGELTGARLETVGGDEGSAYRIRVSTRHGAQRFTPFSIGTSWQKKRATVARIETFARNPSIPRLDEREDERVFIYPVAGGLIAFGLLPLLFVRTAVGRLDRARNRLALEGGGLFGFERLRRPLSDLAEVAVEARGLRTWRLVFRMLTGEAVPLTYYGYPDAHQASEVAETVNAFLAQGSVGRG